MKHLIIGVIVLTILGCTEDQLKDEIQEEVKQEKSEDMALDTVNISTTLVRNTLGESTNKVSELCNSDKVNLWSMYKPVVANADDTTLTLDDIESYTTRYIYASDNFDINNPEQNNKWVRDASITVSRLGDFRGYNHDALPFINTDDYKPDDNYTFNPNSNNIYKIKAKYRFFSGDDVGYRDFDGEFNQDLHLFGTTYKYVLGVLLETDKGGVAYKVTDVFENDPGNEPFIQEDIEFDFRLDYDLYFLEDDAAMSNFGEEMDKWTNCELRINFFLMPVHEDMLENSIPEIEYGWTSGWYFKYPEHEDIGDFESYDTSIPIIPIPRVDNQNQTHVLDIDNYQNQFAYFGHTGISEEARGKAITKAYLAPGETVKMDYSISLYNETGTDESAEVELIYPNKSNETYTNNGTQGYKNYSGQIELDENNKYCLITSKADVNSGGVNAVAEFNPEAIVFDEDDYEGIELNGDIVIDEDNSDFTTIQANAVNDDNLNDGILFDDNEAYYDSSKDKYKIKIISRNESTSYVKFKAFKKHSDVPDLQFQDTYSNDYMSITDDDYEFTLDNIVGHELIFTNGHQFDWELQILSTSDYNVAEPKKVLI